MGPEEAGRGRKKQWGGGREQHGLSSMRGQGCVKMHEGGRGVRRCRVFRGLACCKGTGL